MRARTCLFSLENIFVGALGAFKFPVNHPNLSSVVLLFRASPGLRNKE